MNKATLVRQSDIKLKQTRLLAASSLIPVSADRPNNHFAN